MNAKSPAGQAEASEEVDLPAAGLVESAVEDQGPVWPPVRVINVTGLDWVRRQDIEGLIAFKKGVRASREQLELTKNSLLNSKLFRRDLTIDGLETGNIHIVVSERPESKKGVVNWYGLSASMGRIKATVQERSEFIARKLKDSQLGDNAVEERTAALHSDLAELNELVSSYTDGKRFAKDEDAYAFEKLFEEIDKLAHEAYDRDQSIIRFHIGEDKHLRLSIEEREMLLEKFLSKKRRPKEVIEYHRMLFPEVRELQNPEVAISATPERSEPAFQDSPSSVGRASQPELPTEPPLRWAERTKTVRDPVAGIDRLQNAAEFLEDTYRPWRGSLTRNWLRKEDNPLFQALYRLHGRELHPTFPFGEKRTPTDDLLDAGEEAVREHLGKFTGAEAVREAARLRSAQRRRG